MIAVPTGAPTGSAGERRIVTMLFVDLSGYTDLTTSLDPEVVDDVVGPLLDELATIAVQMGAELRPPQGDGFLAVFGATASRDDDPRRAVVVGERMVARVATRGREGLRPLDVHIGVATGEVLVRGTVANGSLTGQAINLAARLSDRADRGEILVDDTCAALCGEAGWFSEPWEESFQGFPTPIAVRRLHGTHLRDDAVSLRSTVVGRDGELRLLDQAWEDVLTDRSSRLVVLHGEAGIGKSSLARAWASAHSGAVLTGQCHSFGSSLPLSALTEAVLSWAGGPSQGTVPITGSHAGPAVTRLTRALAREERESAVRHAGRHAEMTSLVLDLLIELARERPVVVLLEDLHEAPDDLLRLLRQVLEAPLPAPVLFVVTSRAPLPGDVVLPLAGLPLAVARELVLSRASAALDGRLDEAVVEELLARADGNPLWLVELAAMIAADPGAIDRHVPTSLRLVLSARVDGLPDEERSVLAQLSVAPNGFPQALLTPVQQSVLDVLTEGGFLLRGSQGEVRFRHDLIRDVVYASMARSDRVAWHQWLREQGGDMASSTHHAVQAWRLVPPSSPARPEITRVAAADLEDLVGGLLQTTSAGALWALERAQDLTASVADVDRVRGASLARLKAECLLDLERRPEARHALAGAEALLDGLDAPAAVLEVTLTRGWMLCADGDPHEARRIAQARLGDRDVSDRDRGRLLTLLASTYFHEDEPYLLLWERAYDAFERANDGGGRAVTALLLAWINSVSTTVAYREWLGRALATTPNDSTRGQVSLARTRAMSASVRAEWDQCRSYATQAWEQAQALGSVDQQVWALTKLVEALTELGQLDEAAARCHDMDSLTVRGRPQQRLSAAAAALPVLLRRGEPAKLRETRDRIDALLRDLGPSERAWIAQVDGMLAADVGDYEAAVAPWEAAEKESLSLGWVLHAAQSRLGRLTALYRLGDPSAVPGLLELAALYDGEEAPAAARLARAVAGHAEPGEPATPAEAAWIAEHAARTDPSPEAWQRAADAWAVLGLSEALAGCLAEAGRDDEARQVRARLHG